MEMANRIKNLRLAANMTQEQLAAKIGINNSALAKYENNHVKTIKPEMIEKLAEVFHVSPAYIMGWEAPSDSVQAETGRKTYVDRLVESGILNRAAVKDILKICADVSDDDLIKFRRIMLIIMGDD